MCLDKDVIRENLVDAASAAETCLADEELDCKVVPKL